VVVEFSPPIDAKERQMEVEDRSNDAELNEVRDAQGPRALSIAGATTVPGSHPDAEVSLIGQQQWQAIHDRRAAGHSVSAIAREFALDRKTVRSCLLEPNWRPYRRRTPAASLLDAHRAWLAERAPQVNYSARILWQELRAQHGFAGSYVIVRRALVPLRLAACVASLTQRRFETAPGEQAQCDWGQISVPLGGVRTRLHVFVMTLGYSRRGFAQGFERERMPDLLAAHEAAFAHFGGRCEQLLYDRMRTVVLGATEGRPRLNATFAAFAAHWGFTPRLCQPYRAQTKGKVESGVKYVKRNFVPGRVFADLEDFNAQLAAWQAEVADLRIHGTTYQRPIDRFADETRARPASLRRPRARARTRPGSWLARRWGPVRGQPLLGALRADRQDGAGGARGRALGHPLPWQRRGRAHGAGRQGAAERAPRAWTWRCGTQHAPALRHRERAASCPRSGTRGRGARPGGVRAVVCQQPRGGGTSKTASSPPVTPAAMTTPAQLERLGEHLRKLRLLKSAERLEALLQHAAAHELPYAEFLDQVLGEEVAAKTSKNTSPCARPWPDSRSSSRWRPSTSATSPRSTASRCRCWPVATSSSTATT
jgi:transposase